MMTHDCDSIRDQLPLLALGRLPADEASTVRSHAEACAECRAELDVVVMLQGALAPVPVGLEARVIGAVRRVAPSRRWNPARLAMAATLAAAVIGGTVIFERSGYLPGAESQLSRTISLETGESAMSWDTDADPLLHGGSTLEGLSVEELELILAELES
ncbi:MAG TPA: zf-HC2 domain-containing protein [Longimicrobiales bacterium]|nr:zf-HC2 domain-containing protein [Longimicrobiales bacterium]